MIRKLKDPFPSSILITIKQDFTLFKSIKHFRPFPLKAHTKVIVLFSEVRQFLVQREV